MRLRVLTEFREWSVRNRASSAAEGFREVAGQCFKPNTDGTNIQGVEIAPVKQRLARGCCFLSLRQTTGTARDRPFAQSIFIRSRTVPNRPCRLAVASEGDEPARVRRGARSAPKDGAA